MIAHIQAIRTLPRTARLSCTWVDTRAAIAVRVDFARLGHASTPERLGIASGVHRAIRHPSFTTVQCVALARVWVARVAGFARQAFVAVRRSTTVRVAGYPIGSAHEAGVADEAALTRTRLANGVRARFAVTAARGRARGATLARLTEVARTGRKARELDAAFAGVALVVILALARGVDARTTSRKRVGVTRGAPLAVIRRAAGIPGNVRAWLDAGARWATG
jgi:hypothetical protein